MFYQIKKQIDKELVRFIKNIDKSYSLSKVSPLLFKNIKNFILRDGKRVRPTLFIIGYLGFAKKILPNLYTAALSTELLHDFFLVHDDIIDKSDTRRGKPSMHNIFNKYLAKYKNVKFNGQDLAIITGDIIYTMAIEAFLSIKLDSKYKQEALRKFIKATLHTATGEFIELIYGINDIEKITKEQILKVYDYKTAYYTFSFPLSMGAILAGAKQNQIEKLIKYGIYLGRAFQIKDDIKSIFSDEKEIGKSPLTDLQESKKTIPLWYAYNNTSKKNKSLIKNILTKKMVKQADLFKIRKIMQTSDTLDYSKNEISKLIKKSNSIIANSNMQLKYKNCLRNYCRELLSL